MNEEDIRQIAELAKKVSKEILTRIEEIKPRQVDEVLELIDLLMECYITSLLVDDLEIGKRVDKLLMKLRNQYPEILNPYIELTKGKQQELEYRYHIPYFNYLKNILTKEKTEVTPELIQYLTQIYREVLEMILSKRLDVNILNEILNQLLTTPSTTIEETFLITDTISEVYYLLTTIKQEHNIPETEEILFITNRILTLEKLKKKSKTQ